MRVMNVVIEYGDWQTTTELKNAFIRLDFNVILNENMGLVELERNSVVDMVQSPKMQDDCRVDLAIIVPPMSGSSWFRSSTDQIQREIDNTLHTSFYLAQYWSTQFLRQRHGSLFICCRKGSFGSDLSEAEEFNVILESGLYALTKVIAVELAAKGVMAHLVDLDIDRVPELASAMAWLSQDTNGYTTGIRIG